MWLGLALGVVRISRSVLRMQIETSTSRKRFISVQSYSRIPIRAEKDPRACAIEVAAFAAIHSF